jgi:hypothetical protein
MRTHNVHGEGLVEVQVANVAAADRRVGEADLGVEVGAVQVNLTAVVVDDLARLPIAVINVLCGGVVMPSYLLDAVLEHAESRRVRDLCVISKRRR